MKVLVTGANGFVGRELVAALILAGHVVDALDLADAGGLTDKGVRRFYAQDISVPFFLKDPWDAVFHLAAYNVTHVGDAQAGLYQRINVDGTRHVIQGVNAGKFIFLSTVKVYERRAGLIGEDGVLAPSGLYEKSKAEAEQMCRALIDPARLVILRCANIIGPGQAEKAAVPVFLRKALRHEALEVFGPRGQCLQFLDVEDAARALCAAAEVPGAAGIFNVASDELVRLEELVVLIREICASRSSIVWRNDGREDEVRFSNARIRKVLAWEPRSSLKRSLQRCLEYYAQRP